jgi:hypothetical protein
MYTHLLTQSVRHPLRHPIVLFPLLLRQSWVRNRSPLLPLMFPKNRALAVPLVHAPAQASRKATAHHPDQLR